MSNIKHRSPQRGPLMACEFEFKMLKSILEKKLYLEQNFFSL